MEGGAPNGLSGVRGVVVTVVGGCDVIPDVPYACDTAAWIGLSGSVGDSMAGRRVSEGWLGSGG